VLERRGVPPADGAEAVEAMQALGYLDDARYAAARACAMAGRGYGDEAIRWDLTGRGVGSEDVEAGLACLEPEHARAVALATRLGGGSKAARTLAAKGFSAESIEAAVGVE
jgi:SOS response regulatory protein OraA/RecX